MLYICETTCSCSMMDFPYDKSKYHLTKIVRNNDPQYCDRIRYHYDSGVTKYDVCLYTSGRLNASVMDMIDANIVSINNALTSAINDAPIHIIFGSPCGVEGGKYPTKPKYWATKQLLRLLVEEYQERYPDKLFVYLPIPGTQSRMTENGATSGYSSYATGEDTNKWIFEQIDKAVEEYNNRGKE